MSCTGSCCVAFPIRPLSRAPFADLAPLTQLWVNQYIEDGLDLLAMLVPLTHEEAVERRARFGADQVLVDPDTTYFRCVHWDETTRLCTNYENRPGMCRAYPYSDHGGQCDYGGCDCDCDRAPRVWEGDYA